MIAAAFVGGLILHYTDTSDSLGIGLINIGLVYLFMLVMVIPHELGHAIAARIVGFRVFKVVIGYGPILLTRKYLGWQWEFRPLPIGGVTVAASPLPRLYRTREFLLVLAGPLVNVIFAVAPFWLGQKIGSSNRLGFWEASLLIDLALANILLLVMNLWPRKLPTTTGIIDSDGLALLTVPFSSQKTVEEGLATYYRLASNELLRRNQFGQAIQQCEQGLVHFPDSEPLRKQMGLVLLVMNEIDKTRQLGRKQKSIAPVPDP
ncbi:MAG: M50 family metallopeptidase [Nitrospirota bacterium]